MDKKKTQKQSLWMMELFFLNFLLNCSIESFKVNFIILFFCSLYSEN